MRCIVINLPLAWERRESIESEFRKTGLDYELWPAVSRFDLNEEHRALVDHQRRARLGMAELNDSTIGCLVSHLSLLRHFLETGDDMIAVFEDDARLHPDIVDVLDALEGRADKFDVVKLQRNEPKPFYPTYQLLPGYSLGRVKYHDFGAYGYVITLRAATHLLASFPRTHWEIDELVSRFWDTGLKQVLYVNPPVVFHDDIFPSYIESGRRNARYAHRRLRRKNPLVMMRRTAAGVSRAWQRWKRFRELRKQDQGIDPYSF